MKADDKNIDDKNNDDDCDNDNDDDVMSRMRDK